MRRPPTSTIKDQFAAELKDAMKSGDARRRDVIRQVETEVRVVTSQPGVGEATDEVYQVVIGAYVKKMAKARDEYREMGERGAEMADKLAYEVEYLSRWLPSTSWGWPIPGVSSSRRSKTCRWRGTPKAVGKVVGALMRTRQDLDGALVNRIVREELEG
jgi:uncharacterized protein YqeY